MTAIPAAASSPTVRRPVDVLGIVALSVAGIALLPSLLVFVIGLIPEMNAIWWFGIVLIPLLGVAGAIALVLGIIGIVVASRRGGRFVLSVIGCALGIVALIPIALLFFGQ